MKGCSENSDESAFFIPPLTPPREIEVGLLTGGFDKPYAFGLAMALIRKGMCLDLIGSDEVDSPEMHSIPKLNFFSLRNCKRNDGTLLGKACRVFIYYARLLRYAAIAKPRIFHILWNNKFQLLDRTLLMQYYKFLGKSCPYRSQHQCGKERLERLAAESAYLESSVSACRSHLRAHTKDEGRTRRVWCRSAGNHSHSFWDQQLGSEHRSPLPAKRNSGWVSGPMKRPSYSSGTSGPTRSRIPGGRLSNNRPQGRRLQANHCR